MKTLRRYIAADFTLSLATALIVLTFVMSLGVLFKVSDTLAAGTSLSLVTALFLWAMPYTLAFTLPVSALVSSLLVFGRLSADSEITAMKSCGISSWQIVSAPIVIAALLSGICLYINNEITPRSHYERRRLMVQLSEESPLELIEEGVWISDFPDMSVYVGKREGTRLTNVRIETDTGDGIRRSLNARSAQVHRDGQDMIFELYDVRCDPVTENSYLTSTNLPLRVVDAYKQREYVKKTKDRSFTELLLHILNPEIYVPQLHGENLQLHLSKLKVELNKRLALSLSCLAFVLLGIPLGIRSHRRESSIGIAISLGLLFAFYVFIVLGEALHSHPLMLPHLIVWIPIVIAFILGPMLLRRTG